mmetsp:Transcript_18849/g.48578  ORF Transcript_18849/g.48578 Transcript_18849/m.48578 type:complete len:263 (+) Transcript_18849:276-1064(+)
MNFLSISCLFCSSDVGSPICFCRWSYIIFSTVWRVSPSRSESCEFSGSTFCVSISGSPTSTHFHHSMSFCFCSVMFTTLLSSTVQKQSSALTRACSSPSRITSCPFSPTASFCLAMVTSSCLARVPSGTGTITFTSARVCVHLYLSVIPPLLMGVAPLLSLSPSSPAGAPESSPAAAAGAAAAGFAGTGSSLISSNRESLGGASAASFAFSSAIRFFRASSSALRFASRASFSFSSFCQIRRWRLKAAFMVSSALLASPAPA